MSYGLSLSPRGRLVYEQTAAREAVRAVEPGLADAERLAAAFRESTAAGLIALARADVPDHLSPELQFWRSLARRVFGAVCRLGSTAPQQWKELPPPTAEDLSALVASAPPMRGLHPGDAVAGGRAAGWIRGSRE